MKKISYELLDVLVPQNGTGIEASIKLPGDCGNVTGIAVYKAKDGGIAYANIGLKNSAGDIQKPTIDKDWTSNDSLAHELRYKKFILEGSSKIYTIKVVIPDTLVVNAGGYVLQVIFRCEKEASC